MTPDSGWAAPYAGGMATPGPTRRNTPGAGSVIGDRGQQTLQRLLAASGEVFAKHGFHDARIEEITSLAQVSRGAFYQYFDNKDAIFAALLEQVRADFATAIESASPVTGDVAGYWALHEFIKRYLAVCDRWAPMLPVFVEIETPDNRHATFGGRLLSAVIRSLDSQLLGPLPAGPAAPRGRSVADRDGGPVQLLRVHLAGPGGRAGKGRRHPDRDGVPDAATRPRP